MVIFAGSLICYMGLLGLLAVSTPGIGPIGAVMLMLPGDLMEFAHAPAYGLLAWLAFYGFRRRGWPVPHALGVGLLFALVFGLWTEVAQGLAPGREPSVKDLLTNALGIFTAGTVVLWHQYSSRRPALSLVLSPTRLLRTFRGA